MAKEKKQKLLWIAKYTCGRYQIERVGVKDFRFSFVNESGEFIERFFVSLKYAKEEAAKYEAQK